VFCEHALTNEQEVTLVGIWYLKFADSGRGSPIQGQSRPRGRVGRQDHEGD